MPRDSLLPATRDVVVKYGFIAVTVGLIAYFAITEPSFATLGNVAGLLKFAAPTAIAGLGLTMSMTVGGLDLSVGSIAGLAVSVTALTMVVGNQVAGIAVLVALFGGALVGALNAVLVVLARIPDLLATLTIMFAVQGLKLILVDGQSISSRMRRPDGTQAPGRITDGFRWLDGGSIGPVPIPVVIGLVLAVVAWFFLTRTRWGRVLYAVGANDRATRLAGVRVGWYRAGAYIASGLFAAVAGILLAARIGQGDVSAGNSLLLDSVAVTLIGTSLLGMNRPNVWGTVLGAVLVAVLVTGLTMKGLPYYTQDFAKGVVLVCALIFSFTLSRRNRLAAATRT